MKILYQILLFQILCGKWKFTVLLLKIGHPITTSSSGPLNCFHCSEVTFIYDYPLQWTGLFPGNLVHGILFCVGKAKQTYQIGPHYRFHLYLVLWHQREQGDVASKDQTRTKEKPIFYQECKTQESSINQSINQSSIFHE